MATTMTGSRRDGWRREARAVPEFAAFVTTAGPLLAVAPRGDRHPVLVLPGFGGDDQSTTSLRWFLSHLGYETFGWELGRNTGPSRRALDGVAKRVDALVEAHQQRISVVGWSLGGVFALDIARRVPTDVRQVITLGSPLRGTPDAPAQVPVTSVYSRSDAIVPWQASVLPAAPRRENVEIDGSHIGLGHNPRVMVVVADRLAQRDGEWRPYSRPSWARWIVA